jgi:hypothetical protein
VQKSDTAASKARSRVLASIPVPDQKGQRPAAPLARVDGLEPASIRSLTAGLGKPGDTRKIPGPKRLPDELAIAQLAPELAAGIAVGAAALTQAGAKGRGGELRRGDGQK